MYFWACMCLEVCDFHGFAVLFVPEEAFHVTTAIAPGNMTQMTGGWAKT